MQYKDFAAAVQLYGRGYDRSVRVAVRAILGGPPDEIGRGLVAETGQAGPWTKDEFVNALEQCPICRSSDLCGVEWDTLWCAAAGGVERFCSPDAAETQVGWSDILDLINRKETTKKATKLCATKLSTESIELTEEEEQAAMEVLASLANYISENGLQLQTLWKRYLDICLLSLISCPLESALDAHNTWLFCIRCP